MPHIHSDDHEVNDLQFTSQLSQSDHHDHTHHHDHSHSHAHDEQETGWIDYLFDLLGDLQHTDLEDDHFESFTPQTNSVELGSIDLQIADFTQHYLVSFSIIETKRTQNQLGHPKILYEQFSFCSSPLRGPPSIS